MSINDHQRAMYEEEPRRTPQQIRNLRMVFVAVYGFPALLAPDELINAWANKLQHDLDSKKYNWIIRVHTSENDMTDWDKTPVEPKSPYCSTIEIKRKCQDLLNKYPAIISIHVNIAGSPDDYYIFNRNPILS